jgi:O-antigen/teichoic acid export membrane protein
MQIRALFEAGLRALMPEVSRISASMTIQARHRISQLNSRAMKLIFIFGVPVYIVLVIFAPVLLKLWLGDRFVETLPSVFRIMLIGTFLSLLGVPAYYTLMGTGHVRHNLGANIVQATINLVIVLCVLITLTVSIGAIVWSSSIAMAGATVYLLAQKRLMLRRIDINSTVV